jgi:hypothetical protein
LRPVLNSLLFERILNGPGVSSRTSSFEGFLYENWLGLVWPVLKRGAVLGGFEYLK